MLKYYASLALMLPLMAHGQLPGVYTRNADNSRSGDYQETTITVASLRAKGITLRTTIPVIGDARGMESQPLIEPGVKLPDGSIHDVMVLPSMANVVRGVDAHTGAGLWQVTLGNPIMGSRAIDYHMVNQHWGVVSTGVIDPDTHRVYLVSWISPDGTPQKGVHWMDTLDVATGQIVEPPVSLAGLGTYSATMRKQRSSLVLTNVNGRKTVFFAYGTVLETGNGAAGAIVAFDVAQNRFTGFLPMSNGLGAGIWMGGQGLAADAAGNLYGVTGNGSFNGSTDWGETIFRAVYTPPSSATTMGTIKVASWFSPYSDAGRVGLDPTKSGPAAPSLLPRKLAGMSAPSFAVKVKEGAEPVGAGMHIDMTKTRTVLSRNQNTGEIEPLVYPLNPSDPAWSDEDLGSGGCTLLEGYSFLFCSGKDGIGYLTHTADMGDTMPGDFANAKANCAKLATPPVWFTASPGPVDPCPQDETTLNFMPYGKTRHMHMTPVQYMSPDKGMILFGWGENSALHAWSVAPNGKMTYLAESREMASSAVTNSPGGMPGGMVAASSNHNALGTAVIWASVPYGDANATVTTGHLVAYDAENYTQDSDGPHLIKLWDSAQWGIQYTFNKFCPPVIWDGEVILPNYSGSVMVFTE